MVTIPPGGRDSQYRRRTLVPGEIRPAVVEFSLSFIEEDL